MQKRLYFIVSILIYALVLGQNPSLAQTYESNRWYRASDFQEKINNLPAEAEKAVSIPILFGVGIENISPNFGAPRSGGRSHEGEDIMATKGTPIISPTEAVVLRTGNGESAGHYVYTTNPGGETFVYMHLDRVGEGVSPGTVLDKGSLIGYVGNTGNASGGAAHLHFEIHNSSGNPTDPFPRLTAELSLSDKMAYVDMILGQSADSQSLAQLLIKNFRSTFTSAIQQGLIIPSVISSLLTPAETKPTMTLSGTPDLQLGSSGAAVVSLQKYLITANAGSAAGKLKAAGATGTFGPITKTALVEFQLVKGISPASGYYGTVTKAYVAGHPLGVMVAVAPTTSNPPKTTIATVKLTRDLRRDATSADVKILQLLLNDNGFKIAASGAGSPGKETTYFGLAIEAAVKKFQTAKGIKPVNGVVGPLTRTALNSL